MNFGEKEYCKGICGDLSVDVVLVVLSNTELCPVFSIPESAVATNRHSAEGSAAQACIDHELALFEWIHMAVVSMGTTYSVYINGVLEHQVVTNKEVSAGDTLFINTDVDGVPSLMDWCVYMHICICICICVQSFLAVVVVLARAAVDPLGKHTNSRSESESGAFVHPFICPCIHEPEVAARAGPTW